MKLIPQPQQLELQEGTYRIGYQDPNYPGRRL